MLETLAIDIYESKSVCASYKKKSFHPDSPGVAHSGMTSICSEQIWRQAELGAAPWSQGR